jgi:hypothetical protein
MELACVFSHEWLVPAAGSILFPGKTNNDMLRLHQEMKGKIPTRMVRRAALKEYGIKPNPHFPHPPAMRDFG